MKQTPLIKRISDQNGIFYSFTSALEDLNLNIGEGTNSQKFRFSKFALLNLPEINERGMMKNTIKFTASQGGYLNAFSEQTTSANQKFSESFQNYCLNLETSITQSDSYSIASLNTVSERVFFKWLKELTATRYRKGKDYLGKDLNTLFTEERTSTNYSKVVQYLGDISVLNNVRSQVSNHIEIYFHVPANHGATPQVLFKVVEDSNYSIGQQFFRNDRDKELLNGKTSSNTAHPDNLSIAAVNDARFKGQTDEDESGFGALKLFKKISDGPFGNELIESDGNTNTDHYTSTSPNNWWFNSALSEAYSYQLQPSAFDDPSNDLFAIFSNRNSGSGTDINDINSGAVRFVRNRLDGVEIDWSLEDYQQLNPGIRSFSELHSLPNTSNFEFNTVLLYYDLYTVDQDTGLNTVYATNLFGVLFLDKVRESSSSFLNPKIPTYLKTRPTALNKLNGNAYSFKLNLKIASQYLDTQIDIIDPFEYSTEITQTLGNGHTFSMDLYTSVMSETRNLLEAIIAQQNDQGVDVNRISALESNLDVINAPIQDLTQRTIALEKIIQSQQYVISVENSKRLSNLILSFHQDVKDIINGKTSSSIEFAFDNLEGQNGIKVEKSDRDKKIVVKNTNFGYNLADEISIQFPYDWETSTQFYQKTLKLNEFTNYYEVSSIGRNEWNNNLTLQNAYPKKDFKIFIDDIDISWQRGQTFRIYFKNELTFLNPVGLAGTNDKDGSILYFYTDAKNILRNPTKYTKLVGTLSLVDFQPGSLEKRYVDIICTDAQNLNFILNVPN